MIPHKQIMAGVFFAFPLLLISTSFSRADYHYASHNGTSTYPYTSWETAADSIQKAIDATSPHDTVYISSGDWYEAVAVEMYDSIAILGMGMDSTICHRDSIHNTILTIDYGCLVDGITFRGTRSGAGIETRTYAGVTIKSCVFVNLYTAISSAGGPSIITNCIFDSCRTAVSLPVWIGDYLIANNLVERVLMQPGSTSYGFHLQVHSAEIRNNVLILPRNADAWAMASGRLQGNVYIHNNLIVNGNVGITVDSDGDFNNSVVNLGWDPITSVAIGYSDSIFNNCVTGSLNGIMAGPGVTVNYNNLWGNAVDFWYGVVDSIGDIFRDPMYANPDSGDFRLQAYSPLIDSGDPNMLDVDGTRSDIGAFGGPFGLFYEYRDLAPHTPDSLSWNFISGVVYIYWTQNHEADFYTYSIYRDTTSGFTPSIINLIAETGFSSFADYYASQEHNYYYRISARDYQGNTSPYSIELQVILTGVEGEPGTTAPEVTGIEANYPNPFNAQTIIIFNVADLGPIPAQIEIEIYDLLGRRVRALLNARKEVGTHRVIWDGKDDSNNDLPSGVYFAKISQWGVSFLSKPRKLVLTR